MNTKLNMILRLMAHYKYLITIVVGVAMVGFLDENSLLRHVQYRLKISDLNDQIEMYNERNETATHELRELRLHPKAIEKIARERYFMKADDEDIFILSTDVQRIDSDKIQQDNEQLYQTNQ
jgi:cell division protein FtsB